ncbi:hypothetical protein [Catelliglobosispora koreensis]|uniref:hypothetical protein n=1 Tax=Catelliglobosispora koreensis TaxID=129052 RepID=UPI0003664C68|nr:hypothetical protein [Catelliglobosispora koreensis]
MTDDRLPAQITVERDLTRIGGPAPVHTPGQLTFAGTSDSREELWPRFTDAVRHRVLERAGDKVEWWAAEHGGRLSAVVLGTRALISLDPTVNETGAHATRLTVMPIEQKSFRSARVSGTPPETPVPGLSLAGPEAGPRRLHPELAGFLGQFPARAQQLLQDPFQVSVEPLRYDFYYYSTPGRGGIGGGLLYAWVYMTDKRSLTFGAGIGHGYQEHKGVSNWEMTCWRAVVARGAGH